MRSFGERIRPYVSAELERATEAEHGGDHASAFAHLERAHVLGQASTREHVRVHWRMLRFGMRRRDAREIVGQVGRIIGAALATGVGMVPSGNTGGAHISAFERLPLDPDIAAILAKVSNGD